MARAARMVIPASSIPPSSADLLKELAADVARLTGAKRILDAACGKGELVGAFLELPLDAEGVDRDDAALAGATREVAHRLRMDTLIKPLDRHYDLVVYLAPLEENYLEVLAGAAPLLLMAPAPPPPKARTSNPPSYPSVPGPEVARRLAELGMFRRTDIDVRFVHPDAALFEQAALSPSEVAGRYERQLSLLEEDLASARSDLRKAQLETLESGGWPPESDAEVAERFLVMTDTIIGLQAEVAEYRHRADLARTACDVAEDRLRHAEKREADLKSWVESMLASGTWKAGQALGAPLRSLRRIVKG